MQRDRTYWIGLFVFALVVATPSLARDMTNVDVVPVDLSALVQLDADGLPPIPPGLAGAPVGTYVVTTSLNDPNCVMPFANSGAYVDLAAFGIPPAAGVEGDQFLFSVNFGGGGNFTDFFGEDQGEDDLGDPLESVFFTDDGFTFFGPSTEGGWPVHSPIPTADDPNNMAAVFWRDFTVDSSTGGVSLAQLTDAGTFLAWIIEWDNARDTVQPPLSNCCDPDPAFQAGCPGDNTPADDVCEAAVCAAVADGHCCPDDPLGFWDVICANTARDLAECNCAISDYDFEVIMFVDRDDTPGAYEIAFAYDNLNGDVSEGTIGLEYKDGSFGVQYAYNDIDVTNGMAICFDLVDVPEASAASTRSVAITAGIVALLMLGSLVMMRRQNSFES